MFTAYLLRYIGVALTIGLSSLGAALGQSYSFSGATQAILRQKTSADNILQLELLGLVLIESGPALSLLLALSTIFDSSPFFNFNVGLVDFGIGLSMGMSALAAGIASGCAVAAAGEALSRQPLAAKKITTLMLILQSLAEAPIIFSLIVGLLIKAQITSAPSLAQSIVYLASCLALSIGSIGPAIGQGIIATNNIKALGLNQHMYSRIFSLTLLSEAFVETPLFFAFIIALKLMYLQVPDGADWHHALMYFGATLAMGIGGAGPAIGAATLSGAAARMTALNPENYGVVFKLTFMSQVLIETSAIYALIISFIIASRTII